MTTSTPNNAKTLGSRRRSRVVDSRSRRSQKGSIPGKVRVERWTRYHLSLEFNIIYIMRNDVGGTCGDVRSVFAGTVGASRCHDARVHEPTEVADEVFRSSGLQEVDHVDGRHPLRRRTTTDSGGRGTATWTDAATREPVVVSNIGLQRGRRRPESAVRPVDPERCEEAAQAWLRVGQAHRGLAEQGPTIM